MTLSPGYKRTLFLVAIPAIVLVTVIPLFRHMLAKPKSAYLVGVPERGSALFYGDKQCGICHSINGTGGRIAPDLTGREPELPAMGWLTSKLWNHGPGMWRQIRRQNKPLPDMNPQQMADILAFLYQASGVDPAGDAKAGSEVFKAKGCARCHSVGNVGGNAAPELSRIMIGGDRTEWTRAMLNHAGSMVGPISSTLGEWPQFSGQEMNNLISYVISASKVPEQPAPAPGNADHGATVFQTRCMQCHSMRGAGGGVAPELGPDRPLPLSTAQFATVMWNHAPAMLAKGQEKNLTVSQLAPNDMTDLLAFLASLRYFEPEGSAPEGKQVFASRGCASCHGKNGEGTTAGPRLRATGELYTVPSFTAALWRHGPRMIDRMEQLGMPWPKLEPKDIGNLVSFLNEPGRPK